MSGDDPRPPADRMDGFAAEADALENVEATRHDRAVAVSVVGEESKLQVDLEPIFKAANRYGLTPVNGHAGSNIAELHFKPVEHV